MVANIDYDTHLGRIAVGRVVNGTVRKGQAVAVASSLEPGKVRVRFCALFDTFLTCFLLFFVVPSKVCSPVLVGVTAARPLSCAWNRATVLNIYLYPTPIAWDDPSLKPPRSPLKSFRTLQTSMPVNCIKTRATNPKTHATPTQVRQAKVADLFVYDNFSRVAAEEVGAGDIVALCGIPDIKIGEGGAVFRAFYGFYMGFLFGWLIFIRHPTSRAFVVVV